MRSAPAMLFVAALALTGIAHAAPESLPVVSPAAVVGPPRSALDAFTAGHFTRAEQLCEADGSPAALVFGARAAIAEALLPEDGLCEPCLRRAEDLARRATDRDPKLADGFAQLAIAIGFRSRLSDVGSSQLGALADQGRAAIDKALALDPKNPLALAALGGWHMEIVQRAGPILARITYGATEEDGRASFRAALAEAPTNLMLHYHYALSLLALDTKNRSAAIAALDEGLKDTAGDALSRVTRDRARRLRDAAEKSSDGEIETLVRRLQGYPPS